MTEDGHNETDNWPDGDGPVRLAVAEEPSGDPLIVDVEGFEGPLDLLLELARHQKVDLAKISILALAEQYLAFIHQARRMRIELAADYLVMAAWLAYLKSRLLVPQQDDDDDEIPAEELAARLAFRLQRLQAMREAAAQLMARNRLGQDVFGRGSPEPLIVETVTEHADNVIDLLKAYADRRVSAFAHRGYEIRKLPVWSVKDARKILERLVGAMDEWGRFDAYLFDYMADPERRTSVVASSFAASLEMVREGKLEVRQDRAFSAIYVRRGTLAAGVAGGGTA